MATKIDSIVPPRADLLFLPKIKGSPRGRYKVAGRDSVTIYLDHFGRINLEVMLEDVGVVVLDNVTVRVLECIEIPIRVQIRVYFGAVNMIIRIRLPVYVLREHDRRLLRCCSMHSSF